MTDEYLKDLFSNLSDEDIIDRIKNGLTPEAYAIACRELQSRGIEPPPISQEPIASEEPPYLGDMVILARDLDATEAHILASLLTTAGIHANPDDINMAQVNSLWTTAIGGAKIRVPQSQFAQAQQIFEAFNRGDFALGDDFDAGTGTE